MPHTGERKSAPDQGRDATPARGVTSVQERKESILGSAGLQQCGSAVRVYAGACTAQSNRFRFCPLSSRQPSVCASSLLASHEVMRCV